MKPIKIKVEGKKVGEISFCLSVVIFLTAFTFLAAILSGSPQKGKANSTLSMAPQNQYIPSEALEGAKREIMILKLELNLQQRAILVVAEDNPWFLRDIYKEFDNNPEIQGLEKEIEKLKREKARK